MLDGGDVDTIIVVANLDPHSTRTSQVQLDMPSLGMNWDERFVAEELLTGTRWEWGERNYVRLGPEGEPVHIIAVRKN